MYYDKDYLERYLKNSLKKKKKRGKKITYHRCKRKKKKKKKLDENSTRPAGLLHAYCCWRVGKKNGGDEDEGWRNERRKKGEKTGRMSGNKLRWMAGRVRSRSCICKAIVSY